MTSFPTIDVTASISLTSSLASWHHRIYQPDVIINSFTNHLNCIFIIAASLQQKGGLDERKRIPDTRTKRISTMFPWRSNVHAVRYPSPPGVVRVCRDRWRQSWPSGSRPEAEPWRREADEGPRWRRRRRECRQAGRGRGSKCRRTCVTSGFPGTDRAPEWPRQPPQHTWPNWHRDRGPEGRRCSLLETEKQEKRFHGTISIYVSASSRDRAGSTNFVHSGNGLSAGSTPFHLLLPFSASS